jgi:ribonuclease D
MAQKEILQNGLSRRGKEISGVKVQNNYKENISSEELKDYDLAWFRGEIVVVDNHRTFREVMPKLMNQKLLGFDTESRPSFRKGHKNNVSLIQLASGDLACLFRINRIGFPDDLAGLLADPEIIKAGVAIHDDIRLMRRIRQFNPDSFVDLQKFVKGFGIHSAGLKKLSAIILGFRISKRQQVTDWEADDLSEAQQIYAATDAWVCYEIYRKLTTI